MDVPAFVNAWLTDDPIIEQANARAREASLGPIGADLGSHLRLVAQLTAARTVVETSTGAGVAALWLLAGMRPGGVLTSIDSDVEHHRLARQSLKEAGVPTSRARLISGSALEVLPRLTDGGYDVVHLDAPPAELGGQFAQAQRLIRPGGIIAAAGVLRREPAQREESELALRGLLEQLSADGGWSTSIVPVADGLLTATRGR